MRNPKFEFRLSNKVDTDNGIIDTFKRFLTMDFFYTLGEYHTSTNSIYTYLGSIKKINRRRKHQSNKVHHNGLIRDVSSVIQHEYFHPIFYDIGVKMTVEQEHWATKKLGFG